MTPRGYKVAYIVLLCTAGLSLLGVVYLYGKMSAKPAPPAMAAKRTQILIGRIAKIDPPHLYVTSIDPESPGTYDILIAPRTQLLELVAWGPGEREQAQEDYRKMIQRLHPAAGDSIPPPPMEMKPVTLDPKALTQGMAIGVKSDVDISSAQPIVAVVLRPLTDKETQSGQVAATFPLN